MVKLEVWLYGPLARYAGRAQQAGYAQLNLEMPEGTTMRDLLGRLGIPLEEKGITFVSAQLTDMPGLGADLERVLKDGDRVGLFHQKSMWPMHYRLGASTSPELAEAMQRSEGGALRHSPAPAQPQKPG